MGYWDTPDFCEAPFGTVCSGHGTCVRSNVTNPKYNSDHWCACDSAWQGRSAFMDRDGIDCNLHTNTIFVLHVFSCITFFIALTLAVYRLRKSFTGSPTWMECVRYIESYNRLFILFLACVAEATFGFFAEIAWLSTDHRIGFEADVTILHYLTSVCVCVQFYNLIEIVLHLFTSLFPLQKTHNLLQTLLQETPLQKKFKIFLFLQAPVLWSSMLWTLGTDDPDAKKIVTILVFGGWSTLGLVAIPFLLQLFYIIRAIQTHLDSISDSNEKRNQRRSLQKIKKFFAFAGQIIVNAVVMFAVVVFIPSLGQQVGYVQPILGVMKPVFLIAILLSFRIRPQDVKDPSQPDGLSKTPSKLSEAKKEEPKVRSCSIQLEAVKKTTIIAEDSKGESASGSGGTTPLTRTTPSTPTQFDGEGQALFNPFHDPEFRLSKGTLATKQETEQWLQSESHDITSSRHPLVENPDEVDDEPMQQVPTSLPATILEVINLPAEDAGLGDVSKKSGGSDEGSP